MFVCVALVRPREEESKRIEESDKLCGNQRFHLRYNLHPSLSSSFEVFLTSINGVLDENWRFL